MLSKVPAASLSGLVPGSNLNQVNGVHANGVIPAAYVPGFVYIDSTTTAVTLPASTAVTNFSRVVLQNTTPGGFVTVSTAAGDTVFWDGGPVTSFPLPYKAVIELMQCAGGWLVCNKSLNTQSGSILQVVQTVNSTPWSSTATNSWVSTGVQAVITPSSANSKILVTISLATGQSTANWGTFWGVKRNGVSIGGGQSFYGAPSNVWVGTDSYASDCLLYGLTQSHIDSPNSTSAVTYLLCNYGEGNTAYLNRGANASSGVAASTAVSSITLMEIAG